MIKKLTYLCFLCPVLVLGLSSTQAVTVDLSSPQEGGTVHPGDTVEMTFTLTNDTDAKDIVFLTFELTIQDLNLPFKLQGRLRVKLDPGETRTRTIAADIPETLPIQEPRTLTLSVTAEGRKSKTSDSDSLTLTFAP